MRRKNLVGEGITNGASVPSEPEYVINEELAEEIEEDGETKLVADEETIKAEGALNAEAVQANRRIQKISNMKRSGTQKVPWGETRATLLYDNVLRLYPANTLAIWWERLSGAPVGGYLQGQPKSGVALYQELLKQVHKRSEEAQYKITFVDVQKGFNRGTGRLTMPSTLDDPTLGEPPAPAPQQPPPMTFPNAQLTPFWQNYQAPGMVQQPPAPSGANPEMWNAMLGFMSDMFSKMMPQGMPAAPQMMPPPTPPPAPRNQAAAPPVMPVPQGPPGMVYVPGYGLMVPANAPQAPQQAPQQAPPQPVKSPAEQFRDSISLITVAVDAANAMKALIPAAPAPSPEAAPQAPQAEDGPIKTINVGDLKVVTNAEDGSTRLIETVMANGDKIMGWFEKQRRAFQQQMMTPPGMPQQVPQQAPPPAPGQGMAMPTWPPR